MRFSVCVTHTYNTGQQDFMLFLNLHTEQRNSIFYFCASEKVRKEISNQPSLGLRSQEAVRAHLYCACLGASVAATNTVTRSTGRKGLFCLPTLRSSLKACGAGPEAGARKAAYWPAPHTFYGHEAKYTASLYHPGPWAQR